MYFESIVHNIKEVADHKEAAALIKSKNISSITALHWKSENGEFFAVSDAHIDDSSFAETAILKKEEETYFQIESITVAWIKTPQELEKIILDTEISVPMKRKTQLIINKPDDNHTANFSCGCCGKNFVSNVKKQLSFNQDNGYGICPSCEKYY